MFSLSTNSKTLASRCSSTFSRQRLFTSNSSSADNKGIIERLNEGPVIGDGGYVFALEKRGYVKAGPWTPEAAAEFPSAVKQLAIEFARSGADVMQAFTFYASEDKLENRGNQAAETFGVRQINQAACEIARDVARDYNGLFAGGVCQTPTYLTDVGEQFTKNEFNKQLDVFGEENVDFMIVEYFEHVEECVWAIEAVREHSHPNMGSEMPIAATLCIGPHGDLHSNSCAECALQMVDAGANIVGLNCHFDPFITLEALNQMAHGLSKHGLLFNPETNPTGIHLMAQPIAYMTPDVSKQGFIDLPEFPFALESRVCTRWDMHRFAREAYNMGVRYIGGCCGFEPYHIRALSEELEVERGNKVCAASLKHEKWGKGLEMHTKPWVRARANEKYWKEIRPASGRPHCPACSIPDAWGVTQGDDKLKQTKLRE